MHVEGPGQPTLTTGQLALQLKLPVLQRISVEDLMRIRSDEGEAFRRFRNSLRKRLGAVRHTGDRGGAEAMMRDIERELLDEEIPEVDRAVARLRQEKFVDVVVGTASLAAVVLAGDPSLASVMAAGATAAGLVQTVRRSVHEVRKHPAYFLWRMQRRAGRPCQD